MKNDETRTEESERKLMPLSTDAPKSRRYWIWGIGPLILAAVCAYVVAHLATRPSEPFVSVNFIRTNEVLGTAYQKGIIQVSNRMSFNVFCWIKIELLHSGKWMAETIPDIFGRGPGFLAAHSQTIISLDDRPERVKLCVLYLRQPKPFEASLFRSLPWLERHCPFNRERSFIIYESSSDFNVSSQSKK